MVVPGQHVALLDDTDVEGSNLGEQIFEAAVGVAGELDDVFAGDYCEP